MPLSGPRVAINTTGSGDQTIIAAVANQVITIYELIFWVAGATTIVLKDGATPINGTNGWNMPAQSGFAYDGGNKQDPETLILVPGNAFVINSSNAVNVNGWVYYTQGGTA